MNDISIGDLGFSFLFVFLKKILGRIVTKKGDIEYYALCTLIYVILELKCGHQLLNRECNNYSTFIILLK